MSQLVVVSEARTGAELATRYSEARTRLWPRPRFAACVPKRIAPLHVYISTHDVGPHRPLPNLAAVEKALTTAFDEASLMLAVIPRSVRVIDILYATADHFSIKKIDLLSERRTRTIVRPRQVAMYLSKELTTRSLPEIGRLLGGKDHTTILHGARKIAALIAAGDPIASDVAAIRSKLCPT